MARRVVDQRVRREVGRGQHRHGNAQQHADHRAHESHLEGFQQRPAHGFEPRGRWRQHLAHHPSHLGDAAPEVTERHTGLVDRPGEEAEHDQPDHEAGRAGALEAVGQGAQGGGLGMAMHTRSSVRPHSPRG